MAGLPHDPTVTGFGRGDCCAAGGTTDQFVKDVDVGGWVAGVERRSRRMRQTRQIQQHGDGSVHRPCQSQRMQNELVGKATPIRRIGDDVARAVDGFGEEVDAADAKTPIDEVGADDAVAGGGEHLGNAAVTAAGFPDGAVESFDRQQHTGALGRCRIEIMQDTQRGNVGHRGIADGSGFRGRLDQTTGWVFGRGDTAGSGDVGLGVRWGESGQDLARDDIRGLLTMLVDIVVQCKRVDGTFRVTEVYYEPRRG